MIQHSPDGDGFPDSDRTAPYQTPASRDAVLAVYGNRFQLLLGRRTAASSRRPAPDLVLSGSSTLTSPLLEHGLVDELLLVVDPVWSGTGKRLFAAGTPPRSFELVSTTALRSGIIFNSYQLPGSSKTG